MRRKQPMKRVTIRMKRGKYLAAKKKADEYGVTFNEFCVAATRIYIQHLRICEANAPAHP